MIIDEILERGENILTGLIKRDVYDDIIRQVNVPHVLIDLIPNVRTFVRRRTQAGTRNLSEQQWIDLTR
jgi:hypothetical protein